MTRRSGTHSLRTHTRDADPSNFHKTLHMTLSISTDHPLNPLNPHLPTHPAFTNRKTSRTSPTEASCSGKTHCKPRAPTRAAQSSSSAWATPANSASAMKYWSSTARKLLDTIPGGTNTVLKIVCGGMHTLAVCQGGLLYSWGVNDEGALGRHAKKDVEGAETKPGLVTMPNNAAAIDVSTGDSHVAVATDSGAIVAWGAFRSSSGLWAFTVDEQVVRTPIVVYTVRLF